MAAKERCWSWASLSEVFEGNKISTIDCQEDKFHKKNSSMLCWSCQHIVSIFEDKCRCLQIVQFVVPMTKTCFLNIHLFDGLLVIALTLTNILDTITNRYKCIVFRGIEKRVIIFYLWKNKSNPNQCILNGYNQLVINKQWCVDPTLNNSVEKCGITYIIFI